MLPRNRRPAKWANEAVVFEENNFHGDPSASLLWE